MTVLQAIKPGFAGPFSCRDRAGRKEFSWFWARHAALPAVLIAAIATLAWLDAYDPFILYGRVIAEAGAAAAPLAVPLAVVDAAIFGMLMAAPVLLMGPPMLLALLLPGAGLARPSDPGPNRYGPQPDEVQQ